MPVRMARSDWLTPRKALSLGANSVKSPSCRSMSVSPADSTSERKILQSAVPEKEKKKKKRTTADG